jgi:hypothetical protein
MCCFAAGELTTISCRIATAHPLGGQYPPYSKLQFDLTPSPTLAIHGAKVAETLIVRETPSGIVPSLRPKGVEVL